MFFDDLAAYSRNKAPALPDWVKDSPSRAFRGNSVLWGEVTLGKIFPKACSKEKGDWMRICR